MTATERTSLVLIDVTSITMAEAGRIMSCLYAGSTLLGRENARSYGHTNEEQQYNHTHHTTNKPCCNIYT